jgi:hypothetical protein
MNRDEILKLAEVEKTAGLYVLTTDELLKLASRIESLVREECAQICNSFCDGNSMTANELADIIRKS